MRNITKLLERIKKQTQPAEGDILAELEELEESTEPISGFENVPTVSVQEKDLIKVEFLGEPEERTTKDNKPVAYAPVTMIAPHVGYDRDKKQEIPLKVGDKASINLKRHSTLWKQYGKHKPVTNKKFTIAVVGTLPTKQGMPAKDYRWKEIQ